MEKVTDLKPDTAHKFLSWRSATNYGNHGGTTTSASVLRLNLQILRQMAKIAARNGWIANQGIWDDVKDKKVTKTDIDVALQKLPKNKIDNYIFITTDIIESDVADYANSLYEKSGIEFAVLDCIGFSRHFLHFFRRKRNIFLNIYQSMILAEPASAVSQPLKEAFLALRRVAEGDRG
jgi:hypothetical protein